MFIDSWIDVYLGYFQLLAIVDSPAMNMHIQIFVWLPG